MFSKFKSSRLLGINYMFLGILILVLDILFIIYADFSNNLVDTIGLILSISLVSFIAIIFLIAGIRRITRK